MSFTTSDRQAIMSPEQVGELVIRSLAQESVALCVSTAHPIVGPSLCGAAVTADPTAAWVAEGAEIAVSYPTLTEVNITPSKPAGSSSSATSWLPAARPPRCRSWARDSSVTCRARSAPTLATPRSTGRRGLLFIAATAVDAPEGQRPRSA